MKSLQNLIVYRCILKNKIIMSYMKMLESKSKKKALKHYFKLQNMLLEHFEGLAGRDLWKMFLLQLVSEDENIFSRLCERGSDIPEGLYKIVLEDLDIVLANTKFDWKLLERELGMEGITINSVLEGSCSYWENDKFRTGEYFRKLYSEKGRGIYQNNHVFKIGDNNLLKPVVNYDKVEFKDLIGYESQIKTLRENTESFLRGERSNNVLLYGDRGTGKSSSVKALLNEYKHEGLRVIEMKKDQFKLFPSIIETVRDRMHKFIVFIDDLSFEDFETEYKVLKAVLEGSFETKPDNLLIYVTSNRRHLIKEKFSERDGDIHGNETVSEKLSLFDRFGITIYYNQPNDELYTTMVKTMAHKSQIDLSERELMQIANEWKIARASKSGRSARQLVDKLPKKSRQE
ncbi:ATP-binding protein [Alkalibacter saccharofermentans]|uniref:AAA+ ATPase domain-containing protein n=1 Tax=Alkalibacter saccharofermentans DSM 14828 TaxID=1120975 RepID=A0A1M4X9F7_9FIRM|nr:ATP-binding protein [Alkalibacter saccharofermentans]SHE90117.1 hypothetical protein SAMN02746064_01442 [Alkalibacter saccharofermentans DSM 14828]